LQGKEVNFFSKEDETKATVLLFCALLFLSLSLVCFLISALLSDDEKKNHRARFFFFFFFF